LIGVSGLVCINTRFTKSVQDPKVAAGHRNPSTEDGI